MRHITSACSRIAEPLRDLSTADAGRYAAKQRIQKRSMISDASTTITNSIKEGGVTMYSSIRRYTTNPSDAAAIIDLVKQGNISDRIGGLPGFIAYYMLDCGDGVVATVSVFQDQAGADQSNAVAAEWVKEHVLPSYSMSAPDITAGEVILSA